MSARKSRSGYVREDQRHTRRIHVRVAPDVCEVLDRLCSQRSATRSEVVTEALHREARAAAKKGAT